MLEAIRIVRRYTQAELAAESGISQGVISKLESGLVTISVEQAAMLARSLEVPAALFDQPATQPRVLHFLRSSLPAKLRNRLLADIALLRTRVPLVLSHADAPPADVLYLPRTSVPVGSPIDGARAFRRAWGLLAAPMPSLVPLLEQHGVMCLWWNIAGVGVDAIADWTLEGRPIMLLNRGADEHSLRWAMAHELGHATLHDASNREAEREADEFAAELLMPAIKVRPELEDANLTRLVELRETYEVSVNALARRALDLHAITATHYRQLVREISSRSTLGHQPHRLEQPAVIERVVWRRPGNSFQTAAEALMSFEDLHSDYAPF